MYVQANIRKAQKGYHCKMPDLVAYPAGAVTMMIGKTTILLMHSRSALDLQKPPWARLGRQLPTGVDRIPGIMTGAAGGPLDAATTSALAHSLLTQNVQCREFPQMLRSVVHLHPDVADPLVGGAWGGYEMSSYKSDGDPRHLLLALELDPEADTEETERLGRQLRADLTQLDVEAVNPATTAVVPEGAKGAAVDWSSLLVTLSGAGGVITSVIALAQDWLARHRAAQRIKITLDGDTIVLDRASAQERKELISTWVRQHSGP